MAELVNGGTFLCHSRFHQVQARELELNGETECKTCGFIARDMRFTTTLAIDMRPGVAFRIPRKCWPALPEGRLF